MKPRIAPTYLLVVSAMLALALLAGRLGTNVEPQHLLKPLDQLSLALGKWRALGKDHSLDSRTLDILKPQCYLLRNYMDPTGDQTALFIAYFGLQQEGQIIHSPRHCLPGSGWQISQRKQVTVPGPDGGWQVNQLIIGNGLNKLSVLYWYQGRGRVEDDEYTDRIMLLVDGVLKSRNDGALVRLTTNLIGDGAGTLKKQLDLAAHLIPALGKMMPPV